MQADNNVWLRHNGGEGDGGVESATRILEEHL